MKYQKAMDIYAISDDVRSGKVKLQRGQWVRLGPDGILSRFYKATEYHITAFHYPNAAKKFMQYSNIVKGK